MGVKSARNFDFSDSHIVGTAGHVQPLTVLVRWKLEAWNFQRLFSFVSPLRRCRQIYAEGETAFTRWRQNRAKIAKSPEIVKFGGP